jgi:WD40 repeat protein
MLDRSKHEYHAFLSYSRAVDGGLAPSLQDGLQRFGKPWYRRRALRIFRDDASLSTNPALWESIRQALTASEFFILLASPEAARSDWVGRELAHWLETRSHRTVLVVLTDGSIEWDSTAGDFDWERTTALPPALRGSFEEEPRYGDLSWARDEIQLSLDHPTFRGNVADLAATLHGRAKDELVGEDVRQHRRAMRLVKSVIASLSVLTVALCIAIVFASRQRDRAERERDDALRSQSLMLSDLSLLSTREDRAGLAVRLALSALPRDLEHPDRPYVPKAEVALLRALSQNFELLTLRHADAVCRAAFSPDGGTVVTASLDGTVGLWDAVSGVRLRVLEGHSGGVSAASFSPDGRLVLSASLDGTVRLWDASSGRVTHVLEHDGEVEFAGFSPAGAHVVSVSRREVVVRNTTGSRDTVRVWETDTGEVAHVLLEGHDGRVRLAAFAPDGKRLVTASSDRTTRLWSIETGEELRNFQGHEAQVSSAAFSPSGLQLATGAFDGTFGLWNVASGENLLRQPGHERKPIYDVAYSPDGATLATCSAGGVAQLWDVSTGAEQHLLSGHEDLVVDLDFSPDGRLLATAGDDSTSRLWDVGTGNLVRTLRGHEVGLQHVTIGPDSRRLLTAAFDNTARVWDAELPARLPELTGHEGQVELVAYDPVGALLLTTGADGTARLWNSLDGQPLHVLEDESPIGYAAFTPDGTRVVTASHRARLWDAGSGELLRTFERGDGRIRRACFDPRGERLATTHPDGTAVLWDVASGDREVVLSGHEEAIWSLAFRPDGARLVTTAWDDTARVWDTATGRAVAVLRGHEDYVVDASFSPDGRRVVTASSDRTARVWEAETGRLLFVLKGHVHQLRRAEFSPDGHLILTFAADVTARLWDAEDGRPRNVLSGTEQAVSHRGSCAGFSPDGRGVVTAFGSGDAVQLWDSATGLMLQVLQGGGDIRHASFRPDGRQLATVSTNGVVRLWPLLPRGQALIDHARSRSPQPLYSMEREMFFLSAR